MDEIARETTADAVSEGAAREAALREILDIISTSRDDEAPVFNAILKLARELCEAETSFLLLVEPDREGLNYFGAVGEGAEDLETGFSIPIDDPMGVTTAARTGEVVHNANLKDDDLYREGHPIRVKLVEEAGIHAQLAVPLLQNGEATGVIALNRREAKAFTADEIALVEAFAAQAVIAIENVRQFREVQTRLERETATREILHVISQSREDGQPVFDLICDRAARLCGATAARLHLITDDGGHGRFIAKFGDSIDGFDIGFEYPLSNPGPVSTAIRTAEPVNIADIADDDLHRSGDPIRVKLVEECGGHSYLVVPLLRDGVSIGAMTLTRSEVRPFAPDDVALVENFAAQAVIAIENVRQFREVQERLERERASAEILDVISRSRDDDQPVFDVIVETVSRLCDAPLAYLCVLNEERSHVTIPALTGARPEFAPALRRFNEPVENDFLFAVKSSRDCDVIRFDDLAETDLYKSGNEYRIKMVDEEGMRSVLCVPLESDGVGYGCIVLYRREVAPFTEEDVELVRGYAAQAVIAIQNVRQFRELQERLKRERASAEVLEVISQSRDDEQPVFNAILERTAHLCQTDLATFSLMNEDGTHLEYAAHFGRTLHTYEVGVDRWSLDSTLQIAESAREGRIVHNVDLRETQLYKDGDRWRRQLADDEGVRSFLTVPLIASDGRPIGCIGIYRKEVRAFSDDEIAMVETFASQAVIAIENVQQFKALESLNAELGDRVEAQVGELERMGRLKRFLPSQVADAVVSRGDDILSSHRALIATLFCDIRGFTAFCERAEPEETIEVLQTYHEEMGRLLAEYGAGVEHRMGDGIMAIFNDPLPCDDPAGDALRLAIAMRARMEELCRKWKRLGHRLGFGVGISLGYATVGMVGSEGRYEYTASGTSVNLAARLCDHAEDGEILLSPRAATAVEDDFEVAPHGEVTLKGIQDAVQVYKIA
ncbi:MAG: GAF domain-containing protein [Pseudomonadota bacterium]